MGHFDDLTAYDYVKRDDTPDAQNVGWLSSLFPYPKGNVEPPLLAKLHALAVTQPVNVCRGFEDCEYCLPSQREGRPLAKWRGESRELGSAEIWVPGENGALYAAPNLVIHYIEKHNYLPPPEFLAALERFDLNAQKNLPHAALIQDVSKIRRQAAPLQKSIARLVSRISKQEPGPLASSNLESGCTETFQPDPDLQGKLETYKGPINRAPDFYLNSNWTVYLEGVRACWNIARLRAPHRDDLMLIKVDPPLYGRGYGLAQPEISLILVATPHMSRSLFPVKQWPVVVYVARLVSPPELLRDTLERADYEYLTQAILYPTREEIPVGRKWATTPSETAP